MTLSLCILLFFSLLSPIVSNAQEVRGCAATLKALRILLDDGNLPLEWEETSMDDGKPLKVSISERGRNLHLEFIKSGEGLWAESTGVICKTVGAELETRFSGEQIRLGPAANWIFRYAIGNGGKFTLTKLERNQLLITTSSWEGRFAPKAR